MYTYGATQRFDVTDTASPFSNTSDYSGQYRLVSNRNIMMRFDGQTAEQENSVPLPADTVEVVTLQPETGFSFVLRDGDPDGYLWITRVF